MPDMRRQPAEFLARAVGSGDLPAIEAYFDAGLPVNDPPPDESSTSTKHEDYGPKFVPHCSAMAEAIRMERPDLALFLLRKGALPDGGEWPGDHPLAQAVGNGQPVVAEELIERGADPNVRDQQGRTILDGVTLGRGSRPFDCAKVLIQHGGLLTQREDMFSSHKYPAFNRHDTLGLFLLEACQAHDPTAVAWLLGQGADPNAVLPGTSSTALCLAVTAYKWPTADEKRIACVRLLLEHGADPDLVQTRPRFDWALARAPAPEFDGLAPLHIACREHLYPEAKLLLEHGAQPNAKDAGGRTALDLVDPVEDDLK